MGDLCESLPSNGTEVDVEGAYSTKMSNRIRKLPNMLIAERNINNITTEES